MMLPEVKRVKLQTLTLPTVWQTVIFRNYGYVRTERIAKTLGCDEKTICAEAKKLGLPDDDFTAEFEKRGYLTIIRNNWHLLPYPQLLTLLGFTEEKLSYVLEKDDFLGVKLGNFKPDCPPVSYAPLTDEEMQKTAVIADMVASYCDKTGKPFVFFPQKTDLSGCVIAQGKRIVHGYLSPCSDVFATDNSDTLPDELLAQYQAVGVNGIWLHGLLSELSYYPFAPTLSNGYQQRRENLNKLIARCKKYGVGVYLYLNEPRALPENVDEKYEKLLGWQARRTLCMENPEVQQYLYEATYDLCKNAPDLGGIFTITMSENPTHCHYVPGTECPTCKNLPPERTAATVNNIIYRAMKDSGCKGEMIANLWGWSPYMGWTETQVFNGLELLDKGIATLSVSEFDLDIEKGGVKSKVIDYSISNPGPSELTKKILQKSRQAGHTVYGKIQASNSWECSSVPYLPVFDLVYEHLENLNGQGVENLFLTWTQGGYPSPSVALACAYAEGLDLDAWYENYYGENAQGVHDGIRVLCDAFREYPFSIGALYLSPKTLGPANLWELTPEEKGSTMVCYAYDDYEAWIAPYPYEVYVGQLEKMLNGWAKGVDLLSALPQTEKIAELVRYARTAYAHFTTDLLQTKFAKYKREGDNEGMNSCVKAEKANAETLLALTRQDGRIAYEASNHYFYTERNLLEKIIRMGQFEKSL
jgi:hypothetical protein